MDTADPPDAMVAELIRIVDTRGGLEYARRRALEHAQRAEAGLERLAPSAAREALRESIGYAVERRS
jgi:octaprenyl-diphosphate synthase